ncbi:MAG: precorrin-3B C(17)-methyltransferase [Nitrospirae bacterium]|nr:precorrin-3B C(17)-methyltransferase [Nitrospirota bacterium]
MKKGKIYVVGTGPGKRQHMTTEAQKAIEESDVVVGYGIYVDLIRDMLTGKEVVTTGMTHEAKRCAAGIELASVGKVVSIISSGDPGVYAMAGLVLELMKNYSSEVEPLWGHDIRNRPDVKIIAGVPAHCSCASLLGAPLMHDFASISLSDRLTPWELIEKRLHNASDADFVIVMYNPKSKGRTHHIDKARDIMLKYKTKDTPVGIVKAAMRDDETVTLTTLGEMLNHEIDMQTTVIVGNSHTFCWENWMVTPRGYKLEPQAVV